MLPALDRLALQLAAVTGAQTDRMTRDHGWRLLTVGRLLERLIGLAARLGRFAATPAPWPAPAGIDLLLELFDSAITFRARYQRHEDLLALADLLVLDSANPRALAGVLRRLRTELRKLPGSDACAARRCWPAAGRRRRADAGRRCAAPTTTQIAARAAARSARSWPTRRRALADDIGHRYFTLRRTAMTDCSVSEAAPTR